MNILFLLTPKANCAYVREEDSVRQALERMSLSGYAAVPILAKDGSYCGTLTEGDLLWGIKNFNLSDVKSMESRGIMEIPHRKDNQAVSVTTPVDDLLMKAVDQNFVPVVDDKGAFIGLVTRKAIMQHFIKNYSRTESEAN